MANTPRTASIALSLLLFSFCYSPPFAASLSFNFSGRSSNDFEVQGTASFSDGWVDISANRFTGISGSSGRVWYTHPVPLWDSTTGQVASFTTRFCFNINLTNQNNKGDGMAFFLASYPSGFRDDMGGGKLGLTSQSFDAVASGDGRFVAVEFDTFNNTWDPNDTFDHMGIDVNSIVSRNNVSLPSFTLNSSMTAVIEYNNVSSMLNVTLHLDDHKDSQRYNLSSIVDLKESLPEQVAVGFSAATGASVELHQLRNWSFYSTLELKVAAPPSGARNRVIVGLATGASLFVLLCAIATLVMCRRIKKKKKDMDEEEDMGSEDEDGKLIMDAEIEMEVGPRRFPYHQLVDATRNFANEEKLGQGGFGAVYRGYLRDDGLAVAIKRFSKGSSMQGRKEYKSEIKIISRLRHRNLVQLIGWCHGRDELLLVYELVPNRSLDIHLYSTDTFLTWPLRFKIVLGIGSALLYLHEEWEQCVVHRDIKPSNVMLDESFNVKLGDFGLARLVDHAIGEETMTAVSGTPGYMDPGCVISGRASTESDVYSFGVVLLEVACGRRPMTLLDGEKVFKLVEWVWDLYGRKAIIEAADERLSGDFDKADMERVMVVGLWCAHPDKSMRPSSRVAMATLQSKEAKLPVLPPKMPVPMFAPPPVALLDGQSYTTPTVTSIGTQSSSSTSSTSGYNTHSSKDTSGLLKHQQGSM